MMLKYGLMFCTLVAVRQVAGAREGGQRGELGPNVFTRGRTTGPDGWTEGLITCGGTVTNINCGESSRGLVVAGGNIYKQIVITGMTSNGVRRKLTMSVAHVRHGIKDGVFDRIIITRQVSSAGTQGNSDIIVVGESNTGETVTIDTTIFDAILISEQVTNVTSGDKGGITIIGRSDSGIDIIGRRYDLISITEAVSAGGITTERATDILISATLSGDTATTDKIVITEEKTSTQTSWGGDGNGGSGIISSGANELLNLNAFLSLIGQMSDSNGRGSSDFGVGRRISTSLSNGLISSKVKELPNSFLSFMRQVTHPSSRLSTGSRNGRRNGSLQRNGILYLGANELRNIAGQYTESTLPLVLGGKNFRRGKLFQYATPQRWAQGMSSFIFRGMGRREEDEWKRQRQVWQDYDD